MGHLINEHQKEYYESIDKDYSISFFEKFDWVLQNVKDREHLKILDIGGGSGFFSYLVYEYFLEKGLNCEVYVIDTMRYDTWVEFSGKVTFIEESAEKLGEIFKKETFDIVFAKFVFHHFVKDSWTKSIKCMEEIITQIKYIMKKNSYLCIIDQFYNGLLGDASASKMIYSFTTCKIQFLKAIFKKMGAQSAGVGVCFLSKKMWYRLFKLVGFYVVGLEEPLPTKLKWYMHFGLLLKTWNDCCAIVVSNGHNTTAQ